jgi:2-methylcitrate dehydratase PrpD
MTGSDSGCSTRLLSEFASSLSFDAIPDPVIGMAKRMVLDSLGCALAATTLGEACKETISGIRGLGGGGDSTILGHGTKTSAPLAAFVNGALVHALNYDPIGRMIGHVGVVCLAAPLAVAEAKGAISGRQFLASSVAACEVTARVTAAIARTGRHPSEKFLGGQLLNYFGASVGAGRILDLSPAEMHSALGLALMQMGGSRQVVLQGDPPAKAIYGAFPNHAGVMAAWLAKSGVRADCDVFGEPAGLYSMIYNGQHDPRILADGLGSEYLLLETEFKPWPTSGQLHSLIEAAIEASRTGLRPSDIDSIEIIAHSKLRPWCEPIEKRRRPENGAAAANSVPYCVAKALVGGEITLQDIATTGLNDTHAFNLADRIAPRFDDNVAKALLCIRPRTGDEIVLETKPPLGSVTRPVSYQQLTKKFRDCCSHAATPLTDQQIDHIISTVDRLDEVDDVRQLVSAIHP